MAELRFERLRRMQLEERRTAQALYGWNHPFNVEWAKSRDISGSLSLREWCRHLERKVRDLESNRQHVADVADEPETPVADEPETPVADEPQAPVADEQPQADEAVADEPLVIRRHGEGRRHAK